MLFPFRKILIRWKNTTKAGSCRSNLSRFSLEHLHRSILLIQYRCFIASKLIICRFSHLIWSFFFLIEFDKHLLSFAKIIVAERNYTTFTLVHLSDFFLWRSLSVNFLVF